MYPLVCGAGIEINNFKINSHDKILISNTQDAQCVFNFCFTDEGEHRNDVLKIMCGCEVFCSFRRLITKKAIDLIGLSKVNISVSKNRPPKEL